MHIPWVKHDDGCLDIAVKLLSIIGILFGAYAYFHTVHPIFTKEQQLLNTKVALQKLQKEGIRLEGDIKQKEERLAELENDLEEKKARMVALQQYSERKSEEAATLQRKVSKLESALDQTRILTVRAIVMRHMDKIVDEAVSAEIAEKYRKEKNTFDLKQRCLVVAKKGLKDSKPGEFENIAFQVLELFATKKLEPGIKKYGPMFEIMTFTQFDKGALSLIRENAS